MNSRERSALTLRFQQPDRIPFYDQEVREETLARWIDRYLLWAIVFIILQNILIDAEERWCLEKYGHAYREYMNRTPKWIGITKSRKNG